MNAILPKAPAKKAARKVQNPEVGQVLLLTRPISELRPSPENDELYHPVDTADPDFIELVRSIKAYGIKEPLVVTIDGYIVSGHRRYGAAKMAGLKVVPCRVEPIRRSDDLDAFVRLLATYNKQRVKTFNEKLREAIVGIGASEAYSNLLSYRADAAWITTDSMVLDGYRPRKEITKAKQPMLDAVNLVIEARREFWPLTDRLIHYPLLNDPPLRHASKPDSVYRNDRASYGDLCDLLTRARLAGLIPFEAIADETRPVTHYAGWRESGAFIRDELDGLLKGYYRDLQQSQPNHIEILVEKNTIAPICRDAASTYCIPMTSGRGFCSLPPRHAMAQRFKKSGKERLVILIVSDFDPSGETIAESFARSMRDDFGIANIHASKVALTTGQVEQFNLPPVMTAKSLDTNRQKFVNKHGENVWELEALEPSDLQDILDEAIRSVLDIDAYNSEVEAEAEDARHVEGARKAAMDTLRSFTGQLEGQG